MALQINKKMDLHRRCFTEEPDDDVDLENFSKTEIMDVSKTKFKSK